LGTRGNKAMVYRSEKKGEEARKKRSLGVLRNQKSGVGGVEAKSIYTLKFILKEIMSKDIPVGGM